MRRIIDDDELIIIWVFCPLLKMSPRPPEMGFRPPGEMVMLDSSEVGGIWVGILQVGRAYRGVVFGSLDRRQTVTNLLTRARGRVRSAGSRVEILFATPFTIPLVTAFCS